MRNTTRARLQLIVIASCVIGGIVSCMLASYRSMIVLPNSRREPPAYVVVSHDDVQGPFFTATDAVELNRRFAAQEIPAAIAPSDIVVLNRLISAERPTGVRYLHISAHAVADANADFVRIGSRSFLTDRAASVLDNYYSERVTHTKTLSNPSATLEDRNLLLERLLAPLIRIGGAVADLIAGFCEQLAHNPLASVLPAVVGILYYVLTVAGILASSVFDELATVTTHEPLGPADVMRRGFTSAGWQGLIASPLIFSVVWATVETHNFSMSMSLLAFQNGFF